MTIVKQIGTKMQLQHLFLLPLAFHPWKGFYVLAKCTLSDEPVGRDDVHIVHSCSMNQDAITHVVNQSMKDTVYCCDICCISSGTAEREKKHGLATEYFRLSHSAVFNLAEG